ncbi:MAG: hypothetical protein IT376_16380 [Polyangiaceae bacterium]|nr:hypothetical protein [Polyangiaceae bacterium]
MARVRGMAFLGSASILKRRYGLEALPRVLAASGPAAREVFSRPIDGLALHPYEALVGFLNGADLVLGGGEGALPELLGREAARRDLTNVFKVYTQRPSAEQMIRACSPIWGMYYDDAGYMDAIDTSPDHTVVRILDFPSMAPAHCRLMAAWMISALEVIGIRVLPGAAETECTTTGGRFHEFACRWEPLGAAGR